MTTTETSEAIPAGTLVQYRKVGRATVRECTDLIPDSDGLGRYLLTFVTGPRKYRTDPSYIDGGYWLDRSDIIA